MKSLPLLNRFKAFVVAILLLLGLFGFSGNPLVYASTTCGGGTDQTPVTTSIDLGCKGKGNPIMDVTFGIIRFLSAGVGLVLIGSMIYAGIQYASSRGDPNATAQAQKRIASNVIALLVFIFAYAMLNYVVPGAFLR